MPRCWHSSRRYLGPPGRIPKLQGTGAAEVLDGKTLRNTVQAVLRARLRTARLLQETVIRLFLHLDEMEMSTIRSILPKFFRCNLKAIRVGHGYSLIGWPLINRRKGEKGKRRKGWNRSIPLLSLSPFPLSPFPPNAIRVGIGFGDQQFLQRGPTYTRP